MGENEGGITSFCGCGGRADLMEDLYGMIMEGRGQLGHFMAPCYCGCILV